MPARQRRAPPSGQQGAFSSIDQAAAIMQHTSEPAHGAHDDTGVDVPPRTVSLEDSISAKDRYVAEAATGGSTPLQNGSHAGASQPVRPASKKAAWYAQSTNPAIPSYLAPQVLTIALSALFLGALAGLVAPKALRFFDPRSIWTAWLVTREQLAPLLGWSATPGEASGASQWAGGVLAWLSSKAPLQANSTLYERVASTLSEPQLHLYLLIFAVFHTLEFVITARFNGTRLYDDSFLLNNGIAYYQAHALGLLEFVLERFFFPHWKRPSLLCYAGLLITIAGQALRSLAMVHAAANFSHSVACRKREDHELVTRGVYAYSRHPSYVGFFWWSLGSQLLLANPLALAVFFASLWRFFSARIRGEEAYLIEFFGQEYKDYKKKVGTKIPFIK